MNFFLPINLVQIEKFSEMTGYTPSTVRVKIVSGDWVGRDSSLSSSYLT